MAIEKIIVPVIALAAIQPGTAAAQQEQQTKPEAPATWSAADIKHSVRTILAKSSGIPVEKIQAQHGFNKDLGMDSLDAVEVIMEAEKSFGISIPDVVAEQLLRVELMEIYLIGRLNAK